MKREELKAMGLTDEQVESVMAKNGAEVAALNNQITTLQSEKSQLENDKKVITKEKEDKEKAIADLQKNKDYIYNDLLNKGLDDAKVLKDDLTREAFISLINKDKDKIKLSDDKKSLIGLKEITDNYKKQAPHFFEKKKANGYEPVNPEGDRGDDDGEISMAANFAKEANKSESQNTKSQFFN